MIILSLYNKQLAERQITPHSKTYQSIHKVVLQLDLFLHPAVLMCRQSVVLWERLRRAKIKPEHSILLPRTDHHISWHWIPVEDLRLVHLKKDITQAVQLGWGKVREINFAHVGDVFDENCIGRQLIVNEHV